MSAGGSSPLEEEARFRQQMLEEDVSPGAFRHGDHLGFRVFADRAGTGRNGGAVLPSRFITARFAALRSQLVELAGPGLHFGIHYDAVSDRVAVTENIPESRLPADAVARGEIAYEFSQDGGRGR